MLSGGLVPAGETTRVKNPLPSVSNTIGEWPLRVAENTTDIFIAASYDPADPDAYILKVNKASLAFTTAAVASDYIFDMFADQAGSLYLSGSGGMFLNTIQH